MYDEMGVITGSVTAVQFPTGTCGAIRFKADVDNVGTFNLGHDVNNCSFPMRAGDDTGWAQTTDTNRYWHSNASGSVDYLYFWLQK